jgi:hypothetical protein
MKIRVDFPFEIQFDFENPGNNSREIRTRALQNYLLSSGMDISGTIESYQVVSFHGDDNGEFWTVKQER